MHGKIPSYLIGYATKNGKKWIYYYCGGEFDDT